MSRRYKALLAVRRLGETGSFQVDSCKLRADSSPPLQRALSAFSGDSNVSRWLNEKLSNKMKHKLAKAVARHRRKHGWKVGVNVHYTQYNINSTHNVAVAEIISRGQLLVLQSEGVKRRGLATRLARERDIQFKLGVLGCVA